MKFIHTSDWHIGQELYGYARLDEHRHFIAQLCDIVRHENPDALLVSGDVYDTKIPSAAAQAELVDSLMELHKVCPEMTIVVTAGNHDSGARLDSQRKLWETNGIHMIGICQRSEDDIFDPRELAIEVPGKGIILAAPYFHQRNYPQATAGVPIEARQKQFFASLGAEADRVNAGRELPVAMMAHLTIDGCDFNCHRQSSIGGIKAEKAEEMGAGFDYLALGHIHKPQTLRQGAGAIRYSGSPYPMSFSEDFQHSVSIVEIDKRHAEPQVRVAEIKPLRGIVTFTPKDGSFDAGIDMARALGKDNESYVRIVLQNHAGLPPEPKQEAVNMLSDTKLRVCTVEISADTPKANDLTATGVATFDIDEFKQMSPVALVEKIQETNGLDGLPDDWKEMLEEAYNQTLNQLTDQ